VEQNGILNRLAKKQAGQSRANQESEQPFQSAINEWMRVERIHGVVKRVEFLAKDSPEQGPLWRKMKMRSRDGSAFILLANVGVQSRRFAAFDGRTDCTPGFT
jgi:hypothetical protein